MGGLAIEAAWMVMDAPMTRASQYTPLNAPKVALAPETVMVSPFTASPMASVMVLHGLALVQPVAAVKLEPPFTK